MVMDIERVPVIHPGAAQMGIGNREPERVDEVEPRVGDGAHAPDVASVLRDFGAVEDDMKHEWN
jgi:hypothetical protein